MSLIELKDFDRPNEPLQVEFVGFENAQRTLLLSVPHTIVRFSLQRRDDTRRFEGSLGGRSFYYDVPERHTDVRKTQPKKAPRQG